MLTRWPTGHSTGTASTTGYSLAVASGLRYSRYFDGRYPETQQAYERLFELPLIYEICPDAQPRGPCIRVIALRDDV